MIRQSAKKQEKPKILRCMVCKATAEEKRLTGSSPDSMLCAECLAKENEKAKDKVTERYVLKEEVKVDKKGRK